MQTVIGVVSQKGGVGKSTIARMIAVNYAAAGWETKIADLDLSQGTCLSWNSRRLSNEFSPLVSVEQFPTVSQAVRKSSGYDLLIFDGAPHSTAQTLDIAKASDLVVIPTGTSVDDLEPAVLLAHSLKAKKVETGKIRIAFSRIGNSEAELEEAKVYVESAGYDWLEGILYEKTAVRRAQDIGRCATETAFPTVNDANDQLLQSIIDAVTELTN